MQHAFQSILKTCTSVNAFLATMDTIVKQVLNKVNDCFVLFYTTRNSTRHVGGMQLLAVKSLHIFS